MRALLLLWACSGGVTPKPSLPEVSFRVVDAPFVEASGFVDPSVDAAAGVLRRVVREHALVRNNPWAIGHALLALGPNTRLLDGTDAVDFLFEEYAQLSDIQGETGLSFPTSRGVIRVEPHADLMLKVLTEVGLSPTREVHVEGRRVRVGQLYRTSLYHIWSDGSSHSFSSYNDVAWTLQGLATWAPAGLSWTAETGQRMTLDALTHEVVLVLDKETSFLADALRRGEGFQKRGQGIFSYTCGGAHFLQGAAWAVARGFGQPGDRALIEQQVPILFYRLKREVGQVDALLKSQPDYAVLLLEQRLKFLGHFLESSYKLMEMGFFTPDRMQWEQMKWAKEELVQTIRLIDAMGVFEALERVKSIKDQTYLDYVGDSAHALHALALSERKTPPEGGGSTDL